MTDPTAIAWARVVVVIPTYNEADNIELDRRPAARGAARGRRPGRRRRLARRHRRDRRRARRGATRRSTCCTAPRRPAWARRTCTASRVALERGYDVIGEMDADGSHQPEQLPRLLDALRRGRPGASARAGSRAAGSSTGRSGARLLSRGGNIYARLAARHPGARRHRRLPAVPAYDAGEDRPRRRRSAGYCFQTDLACRTVQAGLRVVEVPIEFVERVRGESKMSRRVAREALRRITAGGCTSASLRCAAVAAPPRMRRAGSGDDRALATRSPAGCCSSPSSSCRSSRSTCSSRSAR